MDQTYRHVSTRLGRTEATQGTQGTQGIRTVHSNCPGAHGLSLFKTPARGWWSLPQWPGVAENHPTA